MGPSQFRKLERQLHRQLPLIGRLMQRRAAHILADDGSTRAIRILAQALSTHTDEEVRETARQAISEIDRRGPIDAVCQTWAETRQSWLGEQITTNGWVASKPPRARVLCALQAGKTEVITEGTAANILPLVQACQDHQEHIAAQARSCLSRLVKPSAVNALCKIWVEKRTPLLEEAILEAAYVAQRPAEARVLSALKVGKLEVLTRGGPNIVLPLLDAVEDRNPQIAERARQTLGGLKKAAAQEEVCRLVVEQDHALARQVALTNGYIPRDAHLRALFTFLTEQWDEYQEVDFDQRLLRTAYEVAPADLRQRIRQQIRLSGRTDLLSVIAGGDGRARIAVLTPDESVFLVSMLIENRAWERLWRTVSSLPLQASQEAVRALARQDWQPEREDQRLALAQLIPLANENLETSGDVARQQLPLAMLRARAKLPAGRINDLAFSPVRPVIAVGTSQRKVVLWNFQLGERQALLAGFAHSIGKVNFSQAGQLVFAERTNSQASCAVYLHRGDETVRLREQRSSVTVLEPVGASGILIGGRDAIALIDLAEDVKMLSSRGLYFWPRAARVGPAGRLYGAPDEALVALLHHGVSLFTLPDLQRVGGMSHARVIRCAAFSPDQQQLVIGKFDGQVLAVPVNAPENPARLLSQHPGRVQGIETPASRGVIISAGSNGEVHFTRWANRELLGKIGSPGERLTSLHVSPDGSFMALGDTDASLSFWDLRVLDIPELFNIPFARSSPNHLAALDLLSEEDSLPTPLLNTLAYIEGILRYRFRYDIEVSEVPRIMLGEYAIEVE